jgi:hypothetical protein
MTAFRVNPETQFVETSNGKLTADGFNALQQIADAAEAEQTATGTVDFWAGLVEVVSDKDYTLVLNVTFAGTIDETVTQSATGTATFTFKINTTALGGTPNDVSTVEQAQSHVATNAFIAGDNIVLTASANSSCEDAAFRIKYTRAPA